MLHLESPVSELTTRALKKIKSKKCTPVKWIVTLIPILSWLPKYNWKTDLAYDATAGFTVAVMNIPQGTYRIKFDKSKAAKKKEKNSHKIFVSYAK